MLLPSSSSSQPSLSQASIKRGIRCRCSVTWDLNSEIRLNIYTCTLYICLVTHPFTWHIFCLILNLDRYSHAVMRSWNVETHFIRLMMDSGCSEMFKLRLSACQCKSCKEINRLWRDDRLSQETSAEPPRSQSWKIQHWIHQNIVTTE